MTQVQAVNNILRTAILLDVAIAEGTFLGAQQIALLAQDYCPVDTGSLKATIDVSIISDEPGGPRAYSVNAGNVEGGYLGGSFMNAKPAGAPVDYAADQEYGLTRTPSHPYMTPASEQGWPLVQKSVEEKIREVAES